MRATSRLRILAVSGLVGLCAPAAHAGDARPRPSPKAITEATARVAALEAAAKQHAAQADEAALRADLDAATSRYDDAPVSSLKARCLAVVGAILEAAKSEGLERAGLKAVGDIGAPAGYRYVKPFLAQPAPQDDPPLLEEAIAAAGRIACDDSVSVLLSLVQSSKSMPVAVAAIRALGNFGQSLRTRERILVELVRTVRKDFPRGARASGQGEPPAGGSPEGGSVPAYAEGAARYEALASEMCTALDRLTGQSVQAPEIWFDLLWRYQGDLGSLFAKS